MRTAERGQLFQEMQVIAELSHTEYYASPDSTEFYCLPSCQELAEKGIQKFPNSLN